MLKARGITTLMGLLTILTAGCELEHQRSLTAPSTLVSRFVGSWSSANLATGQSPPSFPTKESCSHFEWNITEQTSSSVAGSFRAICAGGAELVGTASGTLASDVLNWRATGTALMPGIPSCDFTLTGTARLEGDSIRVDYTGSTCLGPISGTEYLTKK